MAACCRDGVLSLEKIRAMDVWTYEVRSPQTKRIIPLCPLFTSNDFVTPVAKRGNVDAVNKVINLRLAVKCLNGLMIYPGEIFSYWKQIGKATRRKGYVEGMLLSHGRVTAGVGGGLCQLSNLLYWLTLHTRLTVTERHRHSYDVFPDSNRTQPFGSGATCFYNYLDLQIANRTEQVYQLHVYLTDTHLVGEWRADMPPTRTYVIIEKKHEISPSIWGGYERKNELYRDVFTRDGEWLEQEWLTQNRAYLMYEPLLSKG